MSNSLSLLAYLPGILLASHPIGKKIGITFKREDAMDGEWEFQVQLLTDRSNPMEETLIETFGCITLTDRVIKVFVSNDGGRVRRDLCMGGKVVNSQTTILPNLYENPIGSRVEVAAASRLAAA
jgi:hypothetical protein